MMPSMYVRGVWQFRSYVNNIDNRARAGILIELPELPRITGSLNKFINRAT
jgi:hypothetical protein